MPETSGPRQLTLNTDAMLATPAVSALGLGPIIVATYRKGTAGRIGADVGRSAHYPPRGKAASAGTIPLDTGGAETYVCYVVSR